MIQRIEQDPEVPQAARNRLHNKDVKDIAAFNLDNIVLQQALSALAAGNVERVASVIAGARECALQRTVRVLDSLLWIERMTGLTRPVLELLKAIRRATRRNEVSRMNRRHATELAAGQELHALSTSYEISLVRVS